MSSRHGPMDESTHGGMAFDNGPTSTTKALLVSLVSPRRFSTKSAAPPSTASSSSASLSQLVDETPKADDDSPTATGPNNGTSSPKVAMKEEDAETAATAASVCSADESMAATVVPVVERAPIIQEILETESPAIDPDDSVEEEVLPEEAAAVVVKEEDPDDAEINVEALLHITFENLWKDFHLLNLPTYTWVYPPRNPNEDDDKEDGENGTKEHDGTADKKDDNAKRSWIQLQVMARPASLGIILERLDRIGVGTNCGTLSVYKAELCRTASLYAHQGAMPQLDESIEDEESVEQKTASASNMATVSTDNTEELKKELSLIEDADEVVEQERMKSERAIEAARKEWKNAATRLRIEQVREQIVEQAAMSFDFMALLAVASILAGVGLITDNTVVIVASMLVSPIMGPVLGLTFGSKIQDWPLVKSSLMNETLALIGCVVIGALIGLGAFFTNLAEETWPTNEMQIRGEATGLLTGIAIAIPSGMGVCLSILGGNTSSLVGVAISASLLPPAVNSGICFIYSITLSAGWVSNDKSAHDFAVIGGISFALTVVNIFCIWISGLVMFEIKEVAPTKQKNAFWAKDLKVARDLNMGDKDKPDPVDVGVLRKGVKTALARRREKSEKPIDKVRLEALPPTIGVPLAKQSLGMALAMSPHPGQPLSHGRAGLFWASDPHAEDDEEDENVRYVGLEDMATLLGFDEEDGETPIDHAAVARRIGRGRYL